VTIGAAATGDCGKWRLPWNPMGSRTFRRKTCRERGAFAMLPAVVVLSIGEDVVGLGLIAIAALGAIQWGRAFGEEG
jgi:hypothetical protein